MVIITKRTHGRNSVSVTNSKIILLARFQENRFFSDL
jgi:hypothetical protein